MTFPQIIIIIRLSIISTCLFASGCQFGGSSGFVGPQNVCSNDGDCHAGSQCNSTLKQCVFASDEGISVRIEAIVPAESSLANGSSFMFDAGTINVTDAKEYDINIDQFPINVVGNLRLDLQDESTRISEAKIIFSSLEDLSITVSTQVFAEPQESLIDDNEPVDYAVRLARSGLYHIRVEPLGNSGEKLPPIEVTDIQIEEKTSQRVNISYPETLSEIKGALRSFDGDITQPIDGALIRAVDRTTFQSVSNVVTTGDILTNGRFKLLLSPNTDDSTIFLEVIPSEDTFLPRAFIDPTTTSVNGGELQIDLPERHAVEQEGVVLDADNMPIARARIAFKGANFNPLDNENFFTFSRTIETDDEGRFSIQLLDIRYQVIITPPDTRPDLSTTEQNLSVSMDDDSPRVEWILNESSVIQGNIRTFDGRTFPLITVSARATSRESNLNPTAEQDISFFARNFNVVADVDGKYVLNLDSSDYTIKPEIDNASGFIIEGQHITLPTDPTIDFIAYAPLVVYGHVRADQEVIAKAEILAYVDDQTEPVARVFSNQDGSFRIAIPAPSTELEKL